MAGLFTVPGVLGPVPSAACTIKRLPRMLLLLDELVALVLLWWAEPRIDCSGMAQNVSMTSKNVIIIAIAQRMTGEYCCCDKKSRVCA